MQEMEIFEGKMETFQEKLIRVEEELSRKEGLVKEEALLLANNRFSLSLSKSLCLYMKYRGEAKCLGEEVIRPCTQEEIIGEYRHRIHGFFNYIDAWINSISSDPLASDMHGVFGRELCCVIDVLSFNRYYIALGGGNKNRFTSFLVDYCSLDSLEADLCWHAHRNVLVHVGERPLTRFFDQALFSSKKILEIVKDGIGNYKVQCLNANTDPAPVVFRKHDLIVQKIKWYKQVKQAWDNKLLGNDETRYNALLDEFLDLDYTW